jgi:hypothetical protein
MRRLVVEEGGDRRQARRPVRRFREQRLELQIRAPAGRFSSISENLHSVTAHVKPR